MDEVLEGVAVVGAPLVGVAVVGAPLVGVAVLADGSNVVTARKFSNESVVDMESVEFDASSSASRAVELFISAFSDFTGIFSTSKSFSVELKM